MSDVDITTLPISKLRNELKQLGLSGSGTKRELIERYNTYMQEQKIETTEEHEVQQNETEVVEKEQPEVEPVVEAPLAPIETENVVSNECPQEQVPSTMETTVSVENTNSIEVDAVTTMETAPVEVDAAVTMETAPVEAEAVTTMETTPVEAKAETEAVTTMEAAPNDTIESEPAITIENTNVIQNETEAVVEAPIESTEETTSKQTPEFDIEAELNKREARSKKFGTPFNREESRAQLLRQHGMSRPQNQHIISNDAPSADMLAARRAKFGETADMKKQARLQRFGGATTVSKDVLEARQAKFGVTNDNKKQARLQRFGNVATASNEVLEARQAKFGQIDTSKLDQPKRRGEKRQGRRGFRGRKNRRFN